MVNIQTQLRRDSAANLDAAVPAVGELGVANDPFRLIVGNAVAGGLGAGGLWRQGADVASASPCVIPQIGEYFDITGTTGFSAFTVLAGRIFSVQFDGIVAVTHGSGINIPGGTRTTKAGEEWLCLSTAANTVRVLNIMTADGVPFASKEVIIISAGDETTVTTTGVKVTFDMPFAMTLTDIIATVTTATDDANLVVDVHDGATTIMTTNKLDFDSGETSTETATTAPALTDTALAKNATMTVEVDAVDAASTGLKIYLIGTSP